MFDKNGHTMCLSCDGTGEICGISGWFACTTCGGCGYLDWVEVVVGKKDASSRTVYGIDILRAEGKIK